MKSVCNQRRVRCASDADEVAISKLHKRFQSMLIFAFSFGFVLAASSWADAGEKQILGMAEDELISCAGFPTNQMQINGKTFYKFSLTNESGAAGPAGGILLFGRRQNGCEAVVKVEHGR